MPDNTSGRKFGFTTRQLHAGQQADPATGARAVPIYQTTSYVFKDTDHAARLFALEESGNIYTRIMNPTSDVFEQRVADLEGGVGALAASSGHAAQTMAILTLCARRRPHRLGFHALRRHLQPVRLHLPAPGDRGHLGRPAATPRTFRRAIRPNTKLIYGETLGNPGINVFPFEEVAAIARNTRMPLVIDNTFATPYLCRPFEWGANIVVHSTTKFIGGHGTTIGGVIVDGGNFDWAGSGRFPNFTEPDPSYHGLVYASLGAPAFITKARVPDAARHRRLPGAVQFLAVPAGAGNAQPAHGAPRPATPRRPPNSCRQHPQVGWVTYPGLPEHPDYLAAKRYLPKGPGAILGFGVKGGLEAGRQFIDRLQLFSHLANVGDAKSLAIHPASTTHTQLTPEQQAQRRGHARLRPPEHRHRGHRRHPLGPGPGAFVTCHSMSFRTNALCE